MKIANLIKRKSTILLVGLIATSVLIHAQSSNNLPWKDAFKTKQASLPVYWFESRPFIYQKPDGHLAGIEYELILGFKDFVKKQYGVNLEIQWIEASGFQNTFDRVQESKIPCLGASAFSITPERRKLLDFSPPYMADIMVMISNKSIPVMESAEDFYKTFSKLTAITIQGTTYESDLIELKQNLELSF